MAILTADCPRCGVRKMTFDLEKSHRISYSDEKSRYEAFCICKKCKTSTVFVFVAGDGYQRTFGMKAPELLDENLDHCVHIEKYVSQADLSAEPPPEHLPKNIQHAFEEGATCLAVGCFNAACIMFRSCVDLATLSRFAEELKELKRGEKRSLEYRLKFLLKEGHLSQRLKDLSQCIKDDGDDGAHKGGLGKVDAEDRLDFTIQLLEELYTTPKNVELANKRKQDRRNKAQNKT